MARKLNGIELTRYDDLFKTDAERESDHQERVQIVPVQAQYLAAKGLEQLMRTIARVRRQINPRLTVDGILLTMMDSRTVLAKEVSDQLRRNYGSRVFASEIPRSVRVAEISATGTSIYEHDPEGKAAQAYATLTKEVLQLGPQVKRHRADPVR